MPFESRRTPPPPPTPGLPLEHPSVFSMNRPDSFVSQRTSLYVTPVWDEYGQSYKWWMYSEHLFEMNSHHGLDIQENGKINGRRPHLDILKHCFISCFPNLPTDYTGKNVSNKSSYLRIMWPQPPTHNTGTQRWPWKGQSTWSSKIIPNCGCYMAIGK